MIHETYQERLDLSLQDVVPDNWPPLWRWVNVSRANALGLFPKRAFEELRSDYKSFGQSLCVLNDPESIEQLFGAESAKYALTNLHKRMLSPSLGEGLIVAEGNRWKSQRRAAVKLSHPNTYQQNAHLLQAHLDDLLVTLRGFKGEPHDVLLTLCRTSMDAIASVFFGYPNSVANENVLDLISCHRRVIERIDWMDVLGLPQTIKSRKMLQARKIAHNLDTRILSEIRKAKEIHNVATDDFPFDERDFAVSILAGFESVAVTTNWALALISQTPGLQQKLLQEDFQRTIPRDPRRGGPALPTLTCIVLETLRLFPPLPLIYRHARMDSVLAAGRVKKGTTVCVSPFIVQRHKTLWDRPDDFSPKRWRQETSYPAFMPFGLGARQCIGMRLGLYLCQELLASILQNFSVAMPEGQNLTPRMGVSLRPLHSLRLAFDSW